MRINPKASLVLTGLLTLLLLTPQVSTAQAETVERIVIQGLSRMGREAFLYAFGIDEGDPYDEARIRIRFRSLWDLRLFEDIEVNAEDGPEGGKVLVIKVKERPVLASVTYEDNKVVTKTQIEDHFKERDITLSVGKPLDMGQLFFAESAIRDLFAQKGFLDATVEAEVRRVTDTSRAIYFKMTPGGKTRIRRINFTGNEVLSDRKLKGRLKLTQQRKWYWPWSKKNLYHPIKWDQDVAGVRDAYQNQGYLDVEIRPPVVEVRKKKKQEAQEQKKAEEKARAEAAAAAEAADPQEPLSAKQIKKREKQARKAEKKAKKQKTKNWVFLTVPVTEGVQYTLGEVKVEGNEVFPDAVLRAQVPIANGSVLSNGSLELGINRITRLYEDRGYLYSTVLRRIERHEGEAVADIEITVEEDQPYYVGRIEFQGNSATRDRVLRRELQLMEGQLFSRTRLDLSVLKVNQLGYFQIIEEPIIRPIEDENRVAVTLAGQEQGRNEIQIGGGYSGLEGAFFSGVYSTRNFLGRGQVLSLALQVGGRSNRYQISFQEPWFLGKPYLLGLSVFRRDTDFGNSLQSTSSGGGVILGKQVTRFSRINLAYNYESVTSTQFVPAGANIDSFETEAKISSITPVFSYSTINNPYKPTRGTSFDVRLQIAGDFLGGNTSFVRPIVTLTNYRKAFGKTFFAFHAEAGLIRDFGDDDELSTTSNVEGVPRFQRFWLGGDTLGPRVFETRTITPRRFVRVVDGQIVEVTGDIVGQPPDGFVTINGVPVPVEVGGDRMYLFQAELVVPLNEQADIAFFLDVGDALFEDTSLNLTTMRASTGVELRFHLPIFPVPLRLIYGVPINELGADRTSSFTFSIGRSF